MINQRDFIGLELDRSIKHIEESNLKRASQLFYQPDSYKEIHANTTTAPYTKLPSFLLGNLINLNKIYSTLNIKLNTVLLSRESVTHYLDLETGSLVNIKTFLKDIYEQQASNNPIGFVVLETLGLIKEDIAFYCERIIAVRGGFQRGKNS